MWYSMTVSACVIVYFVYSTWLWVLSVSLRGAVKNNIHFKSMRQKGFCWFVFVRMGTKIQNSKTSLNTKRVRHNPNRALSTKMPKNGFQKNVPLSLRLKLSNQHRKTGNGIISHGDSIKKTAVGRFRIDFFCAVHNLIFLK